MITALAVAVTCIQPVALATVLVAKAPPAVLVQWDSAGLSLPTPGLETTAITDPVATVVERFLRTGGILGGNTKDGGGTTACLVESGKVTAFKTQPQPSRFAGLPADWPMLDTQRKESALLAVSIDANALRTSAEALFDAPWLQRLLDRLALSNARIVSLRGALLPPTADGLPRLLELKALATARSTPPDAAAKPVTLIAPGWGGTPAEAAAVKDANWAASVRSDTGGLGQLGRDGGVGTWAGLVRLAVDAVGTVNAEDTAKWATRYTGWQERSSESLRSLNARLQPRGTLACFGTAAAPDLVLFIPSRSGEKIDGLTKAVEQFALASGLTGKNNIWSITQSGPLVPALSITACNAGTTPYVVATIEHDATHPILRQTVQRLAAGK